MKTPAKVLPKNTSTKVRWIQKDNGNKTAWDETGILVTVFKCTIDGDNAHDVWKHVRDGEFSDPFESAEQAMKDAAQQFNLRGCAPPLKLITLPALAAKTKQQSVEDTPPRKPSRFESCQASPENKHMDSRRMFGDVDRWGDKCYACGKSGHWAGDPECMHTVTILRK